MIAICLSDPDIYIRRRVIYILADLINNEPVGRQAPENVRKGVTNYLHNMREETIFGILEVAVIDPLVEKSLTDSTESGSFCWIGRLSGSITSLGTVIKSSRGTAKWSICHGVCSNVDEIF
jgi:hypothetical protein